MKRLISTVTAAFVTAALFTACGSKNSSESRKNVRVDGTAQEAIEEMFDLLYSSGNAESCYEYMYPIGMLNELKSNGSYKTQVDKFKKSQDQMVSAMSHEPEFKGVTDTIEMNEAQLAAAARYFADAALGFGVNVAPENIKVTKGFEMHYDFIDYNGREDSDENECMVYIENDGWKNIFFSASGIEERFPEKQSSSSAESSSEAAT